MGEGRDAADPTSHSKETQDESRVIAPSDQGTLRMVEEKDPVLSEPEPEQADDQDFEIADLNSGAPFWSQDVDELVFKNLGYEIDTQSRRVTILQNVSGFVRTGEMMCIMGPSGAGKTTMMNLLSLGANGGQAHGMVTLNGQPMESSLFGKFCCVVSQDSPLWPQLTVLEAMQFASKMYRMQDKQLRTVHDLLDLMGLASCQHTLVGDELHAGLTTGQKKILSVAMALLKNPLVLLLDEPTTGLDAASANHMMNILLNYVTRHKMMVVAAVHQPSNRMFAQFQKLLLLSGGRVAYSGPANCAVDYFRRHGSAQNSRSSAAEFILESVNADFSNAFKVEQIVRKYQPDKCTERILEILSTQNPAPLPEVAESSFALRVTQLLRRQCTYHYRNPTLMVARIGLLLLVTFQLTSVSLLQRSWHQDHAESYFWIAVFTGLIGGALAQGTVVDRHAELRMVLPEIKNGMFSPQAYVVASLTEMALTALLLSFTLLMPVYLCMEWSLSSFLPAFVLGVAVQMVGELLSYSCAFASTLPKALLIFNLFFWGGLFASSSTLLWDHVWWPCRLFVFCSPLSWWVEAQSWLLFQGTTWGGAVQCVAGHTSCLSHGNSSVGWSCPGGTQPGSCYGFTGEQVLVSLGQQFGSNLLLDGQSRLLRDAAVLAVILSVWVVIITVLTNHAAKPGFTWGQSVKPSLRMLSIHLWRSALTAEGLDEDAAESTDTVPLMTSTRLELWFKGLGMQVQVNGNNKRVLSGVNGVVHSHETLCIVGPSGSGKTTLLNLLTLQGSKGTRTGTVTLNGQEMSAGIMSKYCAFVGRDEPSWQHLTCEEAIDYAIQMYTTGTESAMQAWRRKILAGLGLASCRASIVGNGLSTGQRKRLSIALALAKRPSVLFMDEPTTGLDAASAGAVMDMVMDLAQSQNMIVVCSMHQPSNKMLVTSQKLLLLAQGRVAYCGPCNQAIRYFETKGYPMSMNSSPAEVILDIVNDNFTSPHTVSQIIDQFDPEIEPPSAVAKLYTGHSPSFWHQLRVNYDLMIKDSFRRSDAWVIKVVCTFCLMVALGAMQIGLEQNQASLLEHVRIMSLMCILAPAVAPILTVVKKFSDSKIVAMQTQNGMSSLSYMFAALLLETPLTFAMIALPLGFAFGTFGIPWQGFLPALLAASLSTLVMEAYAHIASLRKNPVHAVLQYAQFVLSNMLVMGFLVNPADVAWPFKVLFYMHPFFWGNCALTWSVLNWSQWSGATTVGCEAAGVLGCLYIERDGEPVLPGWKCDGLSKSQTCWGHTGSQVLHSLHEKYHFVSYENNFGLNAMVMSAMATVFFTAYVGMMYHRCNKSMALPVNKREPIKKSPDFIDVRPSADAFDLSQLKYNPDAHCWEV